MTDIPEYLRPKFTAQQCQDCNRSLRELVDMEKLYPLMEKCGVDCTHWRAANGSLRDALTAIRHYFMDQP